MQTSHVLGSRPRKFNLMYVGPGDLDSQNLPGGELETAHFHSGLVLKTQQGAY